MGWVWEGGPGGREYVCVYIYIYIYIADLHNYTMEINTTMESNYAPIKKKIVQGLREEMF